MDNNIIVVDIEATCWDTKPEQASNISEIIEMGVCLLDRKTLLPGKKEGIIIKPTQSKVSPFCTQLTTLTQEVVDKGISFKAGCETLQTSFESKDGIWASYGDYDKVMFQKQCVRENVSYPFLSHHINVKDLVLLATGSSMGMAKALKAFKLDLVGTHHRGVDDAYNIARILAILIGRLRE